MRVATLRILVPIEEGVKVDTLQRALQSSLRKRGTVKISPEGVEEAATDDEALLNDQLVFWAASEIRRGAETRAAKKRTGGAADG